MTRLRWIGALTFAAAGLVAAEAHATPVDDLRAGASVFVESASGRLDDTTRADGGFTFRKAPGSLDMTFNRADFGLGAGPAVTLRVTPIDGSLVEIAVDHEFSPAAEISGGNVRIRHATGSALARVLPVPGSSTPYCADVGCAYSVRLELLAGGNVTVKGSARAIGYGGVGIWTSFTKNIGELTGVGFGGIARPALASFTVSAPDVQCATLWETRTYWGVAKLSGPSPAYGAIVDFEGSNIKVVPPRRVTVEPGKTEVRFPFRFGPNEKGLFALRASSGGASSVQFVNVRPCVVWSRIVPRYSPLPIDMALCRSCIEDAKITDRMPGVIKVPEGWLLLDPEWGAVPLDALVGGRVLDAAVGALGDIAGTVEHQGAVLSFRLSGGIESPEVSFGPPAWSHVVGPTGTVFSTQYGPDQRAALVVHDADGAREVPVPEGMSSVAGALPSGAAVVNTDGPHGPRAWVVGEQELAELPSTGWGLTVTGVNASGRMVGIAYDEQWTQHIVTLVRDGEPEPLQLSQQFAYVWPVGLTDDGLVLVNAWTPDWEPMPLLVTPQGEVVPLAELLDAPDLQLREAVSITPGGRIVARVLRDGEPTVVTLAPSFDDLSREHENAP